MSLFENISGILFRPHKQCKTFLGEKSASENFKKTFLFVLYGAIILSIIFVFWILYPERVYYGVPSIEFRNLQFITLSEPLNLVLFFCLGLILLIGIHFVAIGLGNYLLGGLVSRKKLSKSQCKKYLTVYGYTILPLLLFGVFTIFWIYFYEKLYIATEISPYIDFTLPTITFFCIFFGFLGWKWIIEMRINQAFFDTSLVRAIIPELVQVALFVGFIFLLDFIIGAFAGGMAWV